MGKYIYGFVREPQPRKFEFTGIEDAEVYTVSYRELAATVTDTGLADIDPTRRNVLAHTLVQDRLLRMYPAVLPASFGLIAGSGEEVLGMVREHYTELAGQLDKLHDCVEIALKVSWNQEAVSACLEKEDPEFVQLKERLRTTRSPLEAQGLLMRIGYKVEQVAREWKIFLADEVYQHLRPGAIDAVRSENGGVRGLLNASFLIKGAEEGRFQEEVRRLDGKFGDKLSFKYIGPLPPYNFVNVKLGLAGRRAA
ncbi:MAG: GvpL/GvpF family gas vesicle protein [Chloroflexi bacterium]|nr:GvpL/GvpF family gas vesicle protein [Chloroflexota bacterium]